MSTLVSKNVQIGEDGTASNNFTAYQPAAPDGTLRIGNGNSGSVTDAITLTSAGNVGIGTSSPDSGTPLHVAESSASLGANPTASAFLVERAGNVGMTLGTANTGLCSIFMGDSDSLTTGRVQYDNSGNSLQFWANSLERMRINSAGNVGIGNSSPTQKLDVTGTVKATAFTGDGSGLTGVTSAGKAAVLSMVFG